METNKTLAEINAERKAIIEEGIKNIRSKRQYGVVYSARELSIMSGGLIPEKNLQASFERGRRDCYSRCRSTSYLLYGQIWVEFVVEYTTLTYKIFDENEELVRTYTKKKPITKVKF